MKIAYVYDAVYPWVTGGVERRVYELSTRLADAHDVHLYGLKFWDEGAVIERDGVTLHGVTNPPDFYTNGRRSISEALQYSLALVRPLRRERFDVIDCQEFPYFPTFPAKLSTLGRRSQLYFTWHEVWDDYWYEYLGKKGVFGKVVERTVARLPDTHLAVSERTRRDAERIGATRVEVVPNGISRSIIDGIAASDNTVELLFVGRLIQEKNVDLLIQAVEQLRASEPNVRCLILGDGPEKRSLQALVERLDLSRNIEFVAPLDSHEDVLRLMQAAGVFVLPSRREGFGMTVLEALACGTPVVTVSHPQNAAQELVRDDITGVICEPNPQALTEGIRAARSIDAKRCVASTRDFEWDEIAVRIERLYEQGH